MNTEVFITIAVEGVAKADIVIENRTVHYRFVTVDSMDRGRVPLPSGCSPDKLIKDLVEAAGLMSDSPVTDDLFSFSMEIDGKEYRGISEKGLRTVIDLLLPLSPEFSFLGGFR